MVDPREELQECQLCQNDDFTAGTRCEIPTQESSPQGTTLNNDAEALVKQITDQIIAGMG